MGTVPESADLSEAVTRTERYLDAVRSVEADAVAMSTRGRGGVGRLILGSVADKVIRGAPVPVLVHRPAMADDA